MNKDILKWGLLALGAYLIYRYIEEQGGISNLFGATTGTGTGKCATGFTLNGAGQCIAISAGGGTGAGTGAGSGAGSGGPGAGAGSGGATPPTPPVVDMTGLTVIPDVNNSLTGYVKINGVPTKLSIITASGAIYDMNGTDITATLQGEGIDIVAIRNAFQAAGPPANYGKCIQPNIFNSSGVCVDPMTMQPIPNTMTQAQQNAGVSGLSGMRYTPPWLM